MKFDPSIITTKTFWAGVTGCFSGAVMIYNGHVLEGIQTIIVGISSICIRDAISKK